MMTDYFEKTPNAQKKLDDKLLVALERKENISAARIKKAEEKASLSKERAQLAIKQKEIMMEGKIAQNQSKFSSAKHRRDQLRLLEKEKRQVIATKPKTSQIDVAFTSPLQERLDQKLKSANERKENHLAKKASKAADHVSSTSQRGIEALKQKEIISLKLRNEIDYKFESAAMRKARLEEESKKRKENAQQRREYALDFAKEEKFDRAIVEKWESRSVTSKQRLSVVEETDERSLSNLLDSTSFYENLVKEEDNGHLMLHFEKDRDKTYFLRKAAARDMLSEEIRLADLSKKRELFKITEERREMERKRKSFKETKRDLMLCETKSMSSNDSIKTSDICSFDEEDISISGMSTIKGEESKRENEKSKATLAELDDDAELSQFQIMQAFLLAEEASMKGDSEFKTCDRSINDLKNVKISSDVFEDENKKNSKIKSPKNIISLITKQWF